MHYSLYVKPIYDKEIEIPRRIFLKKILELDLNPHPLRYELQIEKKKLAARGIEPGTI